jgi:hypothetical protein
MVNNKLGRAWQKKVMSKFKMLSLHLSEGTEETTTKSLGEFSRYLGLNLNVPSVAQDRHFAFDNGSVAVAGLHGRSRKHGSL